MIDKILKYRFFDDEQGKMGWNVSQAGGGLLQALQSTSGARPDWSGLMTATFIAGAPILALFALLGRKVVDSIQFSGIK